MSRVELYEAIRKANRDEGLGVRALATRFHVHRRSVREALAAATPRERKVAERASPVLGPWHGQIRQWLTDDLGAPRKQRHTAHWATPVPGELRGLCARESSSIIWIWEQLFRW